MKNEKWPLVSFVIIAVALGGLAVGYGSGLAPDVFGHTSDEVRVLITPVTNTCTNGTSTSCVATCPAPGANEEYVAISGLCQSLSGSNWRQIGSRDQTSWTCQDMTHTTAGQVFIATVYCLKGGTP